MIEIFCLIIKFRAIKKILRYQDLSKIMRFSFTRNLLSFACKNKSSIFEAEKSNNLTTYTFRNIINIFMYHIKLTLNPVYKQYLIFVSNI